MGRLVQPPQTFPRIGRIPPAEYEPTTTVNRSQTIQSRLTPPSLGETWGGSLEGGEVSPIPSPLLSVTGRPATMEDREMRRTKPATWAAAGAIILVSCGGAVTTGDAGHAEPAPVTAEVSQMAADIESATMSLAERMSSIDEAVAAWRKATSIQAAQVAAETAANLIVGPNGPGYGDRNRDRVVSGDTIIGVLPGLDGTPDGLATALAANDCVARDVLGGTWANSGAEWGAMLTAIDDWRTDNNTMPSLASHPMRIVGWATFTLRSGSLDEAHEYGGHAKLHVDIALRAIAC